MDYYKILNEEECHYGLQYKFGLNIDPIKFNPSGDCRPGGIYFSKEDILYFIDYGPWIRKVTLPEDAQIYENPSKPKKWKADKIILGKKEKISAKVIKRLIDEGINPKIDDSFPLRWAAKKGYTEIVKLLIPVSDPKICDSEALRNAAENGHTEIVKLLIPVSDPKAYDSEALKLAAGNGHTEIVKLLIPVSDPKMDNSEALRWTAEYGHIKAVKLLIPVSDVKAQNNYAIKYAAKNGHFDIVKLLIPVSEINDNIIDFCNKYCTNQEILDLIMSYKKGTIKEQ